MPFFETAAALIALVLLGRYLENIAKGKTSEALVKLMEMQSKTAMLLEFDKSGNNQTRRDHIRNNPSTLRTQKEATPCPP